MDIVPVAVSIDFAGVAGLILTSENAATTLKRAAPPEGLRCYCVGDQTARVASELGLDALSASGAATDLVKLIVEVSPSGALLHLRGRHVTGDVVGTLRSRGIEATDLVTYDQKPRPLSSEAKSAISQRPTVIPLYSPRSAMLVREALEGPTTHARIIAISAAAAEAWGSPEGTKIAARPDGDAMLDAIVDEMSRDSSC